MASGVTNRGKYTILQFFRDTGLPTNFYVALITVDNVPDADDNLMSDLTEITAGNGYTTGGYSLDPNATDFDVLTEDDANDKALIQIKDVQWTAAGGTIPSAGNDARYAVLTDDNATVADREVYVWWDLVSGRSIASGDALILQDLQIDALAA